ncbi:YkoF-like protein [Bombardia bombarda]|uniref:YkoF-like protein n=1 Tax=Bombardia bombarda TaxID=252184 RepID=A0AA39XBQ8_9PEZI|nr:YkoF-like protein [Bombardia bombarda]
MSQRLLFPHISPSRLVFLSSSSSPLLRKRFTMSAPNYSAIKTPASCYADFCLIPVGTGNVSVAKEVAEVQKLLKASGLTYTMHSAGTTVEGSWDEVMTVIGQAHALVHQGGVQRVQSSMRVGTRTDKKQTAEQKVKRVEALLAEDGAAQ